MGNKERTFFFVHDTARENAARMCHQAPGDWMAVFKPTTRTLMQNAKLHAMLTDISDQAIYMGKKRSVEFWKGLFELIEYISAWAAMNEIRFKDDRAVY